ncbi:sensor domain-containing protein [Mycobacterium sp. IS-836]|uniref:sensor domain-containing protein n=1 Tax=Mycobacterium sp. IS-836 TaxID=1834160 RepID=UPI0018E9E9A1|nr:sensor domain-containing protein [Mycobacterium sp. IS-836]
MTNRWCSLTAALSVAMIAATACTQTAGGTAQPAPNLKPRPLTGSAITQVLLDDAALTGILNQSFERDTGVSAWSGGPEKLRHPFDSATPADCLGVAVLLDQRAYQSSSVKDVAGASWRHTGEAAKVQGVIEGVTTLPTAADAAALFTKFSAQWSRCDGTTLSLPAGEIGFTDKIADVRVANSVLAATVSIYSSYSELLGGPMPDARAIGVRGNCLVEVDAMFSSGHHPSDQGSGDINTSAVNIAHAMMDKVSGLS